MKSRIVCLLILICSLVASGQEIKPLDGFSLTPPKFAGANITSSYVSKIKQLTIEEYLRDQVDYPQRAIDQFAQGTEVVSLTVTLQGTVTDIKVINSVSPEIDRSVIAALAKTGGMWKPALINGEPVSSEIEISLVYKISELQDYFKIQAKEYFTLGAKSLLIKRNPSKALRFFDSGLVLLPNDKSLLALRGLARFELGDKQGAIRDWTRIKILGGMDDSKFIENYYGTEAVKQLSMFLK